GFFAHGGIIFYLDGEGGGMVCAENDQSSPASWGCNGTFIGGTQTNIGSGATNTNIIVTNCSTTGIAARICDDLILNDYTDWYLPSKDELNLMYVNLHLSGLGGFSVGTSYWTSSEYGSFIAWRQGFLSGDQTTPSKRITLLVRPVRSF
ncbi:MAG TPA: hypothetical protein PK904_17805, partial [Bacteroidales bacterium]|nr:hypothetical protein [Bacteroidales bacterium]